MANSDRHPAEAELVKFLERKDQTAAYVRETADWISKKYPGSAPNLLPRLRTLFKSKRQSEGQRAA